MPRRDTLTIRNERLKAAGNLMTGLGVIVWTASVIRPMFDNPPAEAHIPPGDVLAWAAVGLAAILCQHYLLGLIEEKDT